MDAVYDSPEDVPQDVRLSVFALSVLGTIEALVISPLRSVWLLTDLAMVTSCPLQVKENKRYAAAPDFTVSEVAAKAAADMGKIDIVVSAHDLTLPPSSRQSLI